MKKLALPAVPPPGSGTAELQNSQSINTFRTLETLQFTVT
jgi:hypothetical protein